MLFDAAYATGSLSERETAAEVSRIYYSQFRVKMVHVLPCWAALVFASLEQGSATL